MSWRRFNFQTMGTVGNVLYPIADALLEEAIGQLLAKYERTFSTYDRDSEISQINYGVKSLTEGSALLLRGYEEAMRWYLLTGATFNPYPSDAYLDLNGVAKAMAIDAIGELLDAWGITDWSVNIGGDVLVRGVDERGGAWVIGITDPNDRSRLWGVVKLDQNMRALATSGFTERGAHIWTAPPYADLVQASVAAPSILEADVLATTAIAAGDVNEANALLARHACASLLHESAGQAYANASMRELMTN